ncbi:location of vulva defective 1 [Channa argus]|uniref:location of vulva defective 1 n=1 Tax=Channa argus TaxID=215402 RepID=UPI00351FD40E
MSNGEKITKTDPKVHLQQNIRFPSFKVNNGLQTTQEARLQEANEKPGTERHGSEPNNSSGKAGKVDMFTQMFATKAHLSTTTSSALSLVSGTEPSTSSPTSVSAAHTPDVTFVTTVMLAPTSPLHHTKTDLPLPETDKDEEKQAETGLQQPPLFQTWSVGMHKPTKTLVYNLSTSATLLPVKSTISFSAPAPTFSAPTSQSSMEKRLSHVTPLSETSKTTKQISHLAQFHNITMNTTSKVHTLSISLGRRPVCPYPPLPAHGTFYFRNVENPGPREYRHYIQYACYPGYTLAHGDIHSYCQQGAPGVKSHLFASVGATPYFTIFD